MVLNNFMRESWDFWIQGPQNLACIYFCFCLFHTVLRIGESPSICPFLKNNGHEAPKGPSAIIFSGMDRYEDFLLLKIHLNIMTGLHRLTWIVYSWFCAKILKFYFFANSITLWEAHKNINYTLHSGFKRARQTVHYFCVFWHTCIYKCRARIIQVLSPGSSWCPHEVLKRCHL